MSKKIAKKPVAKKAPAKKATKKAAPKKDTAKSTGLSITQIAKNLKMSPKVARAKLRRHGYVATEGRHNEVKEGSKDHTKIVEILEAGRPEKS